MNKSLTDQELEYVAQVIKDKIFVPRNRKRVTVFLCGADIKNDKTARSQMAAVFSHYPRYELLYPEDLFDDLLAGQGQHSLLKLEGILADSVDAIVLFPESPGSFAEIGAFSNNEQLARKMVVLSNKRYKSNKSFINYGPYRLIKSSGTGKVIHINYDHLTNPDEYHRIYRNVNNYITQIRREHPVEKDVANILEAENFILPCIYLLDKLNNVMLSKLIGFATNQDKVLCDIATKSSLGRLAFKKYISRTATGYQVTPLGAEYVRNTFNNKYLDKVRIEILNAENRRNASVCYDRIVSGAHP
ncbi:retron St85 family effector protein [Vibrio aphrogenes]|uniref:retron St85 family effector protein n=1 Tax=Vibrio aphrogenes TaxID=1891186 RepID=UPI000B34C844|nr:retron St85 family effector protein [Vibrio aphrogenes]